MDFFGLLEKGWKAASEFGTEAYDVVESYLDKGIGFLDAVGENKMVSSIAGFAAKSLFNPETGALKGSGVKGQRMSSVSPSAGSAAYKASAVDMGYTAKVQNAIRAAQNARVGSKIDTTIGYISSKPAKGPLLKLDSDAAKIAVAPRAK